MIHDLLVLGHPDLRQKCYDVTEFGESLAGFLKELRDTMRAARGIGLAAPQVGSSFRVAVLEIDDLKIDLVNPKITLALGERTPGEEGCLSIPDVFAMVSRSENLNLTTHDPRTGAPKSFNIKGLMARAIQHEIDHLDGKLFIDHLGEFKRRQVLRKWQHQSKQYPNCIRHLG